MKPIYLTITPFFPKQNDDFRGFFIYDQVKAIQETGLFEVVVLKPKKWYQKEGDYTLNGINVYLFNTFEIPSNILPGIFDFLSILFFKFKLNKLGVKLERMKVVHSHVIGLGVYANSIKKKNISVKTILQHHGFDVFSLENGYFRDFKWHRFWVQVYGRRICNRIDLHVGVSHKTLKNLSNDRFLKIKDNYTLYNGVDSSKFFPIVGLKDNKVFAIGCVANFLYIKGQIILLNALKILVDAGIKDVLLKFVGSGETLEMCKNFTRLNGLSEFVQFHDYVPQNKLVYFYNSIDLFVLPSFYEAFGCVFIESHSCGIPFIAAEGQGIEEVLTPEGRMIQLFKGSNPKELADLILKYYHGDLHLVPLSLDLSIGKLIDKFLKTKVL